MEAKQILIRILSTFGREGVDAAKRAMAETANQARQVSAELAKAAQVNLGQVGGGLGTKTVKDVRSAITEHNKLLRLTSGLDKELRKVAVSSDKTAGSFRNLGTAARNARTGFVQLSSGILGAINPLNLFDNIFGRVTIGLAVWQAWRVVKYGCEAIADATVTANSKMQAALGAFTAFSGGSRESAETFIAILKLLDLLRVAPARPLQTGREDKLAQVALHANAGQVFPEA